MVSHCGGVELQRHPYPLLMLCSPSFWSVTLESTTIPATALHTLSQIQLPFQQFLTHYTMSPFPHYLFPLVSMASNCPAVIEHGNHTTQSQPSQPTFGTLPIMDRCPYMLETGNKYATKFSTKIISICAQMDSFTWGQKRIVHVCCAVSKQQITISIFVKNWIE